MQVVNKYKGWTLFLDRDGVINKRIVGSYVRNWSEFFFEEGVLDSLKLFSEKFEPIVVVTNQQGVYKEILSENDLILLHEKMCQVIESAGGRIDKCYYCPKAAKDNPPCRKPNTGMGVQAQEDFPAIDFSKSIMVGDSLSDMEFGYRLKMKTILISTKEEEKETLAKGAYDHMIDERYTSLYDFSRSL